MRPPKISRDELLQRCASTFKRHGYHGTTMDLLSAACGLTKASFYHHYPNKESLLKDVLEWTHERLRKGLFQLARDDTLPPRERLEKIARRAAKLFQDGTTGCLMGVVAVDAAYTREELMVPIRAFLDDWAEAFAHLFRASHGEPRAKAISRQLVADFEGAVLLARIYDDASYIEAVGQRALEMLEAPPAR